jgi:hypothetical protein
MRISRLDKWLVVGLAISVSACAAIRAERQAEEKSHQEFVHRVDFAHVWVTTGEPPEGKPYSVLGEVRYSEPWSPDAIDTARQEDKLKAIACKRWPDRIDALIEEKSGFSADNSTVIVSAKAIHYLSSADRKALHNMDDEMVVSPSGR